MLLSENNACVPGIILVTYAFKDGVTVNVDAAGNEPTPANG